MDNILKVMIAEDDPHLRQYIASLLGAYSEVEVVASAANGMELLALAEDRTPDAVFMDIAMPELDGFSTAVRLLEKNPRTAVVFITGHVNDAIRGYDIGAVDYLAKPISPENLKRSISRIKARQIRPSAPMAPVSSGSIPENRLVFKNGREIYFLNPSNIYFIEKIKRLCVIYTVEKMYYCTETLDALGARLNDRFMRSHRGYIINIDKVEKIEPDSDSSLSLSFYGYNGHALLSKNKLDDFMMRLAGEYIP